LKKLLTISLILFSLAAADAQDVQFSQFYGNSMFMNPAFAGGFHKPRVSMHYRGQWLNLDARYNTMLASFDDFSSKYNSGYGIMVMKDVQGGNRLSSTEASLLYSYEIKVNRKITARAGGQASFVSRNLDYSQLRFPSQFDDNGLQSKFGDSHTLGNDKINFVDVTFGGLVFTETIWAGFSGHHLNEPNQSFINNGLNNLPMSLSFIAGYKYQFNKKNGLQHNNVEKSISPTVHYKVQGKADQVDFGVYGHYNMLMAGFWYRGIPFKKFNANIQNSESFVVMFGVRTSHFIFRYSYDAVVSTLNAANPRGGHEIGITLVDIFKRSKSRPLKRIPCPNFI
jgi:type IX secretion system PorP/SprF family membrane protein